MEHSKTIDLYVATLIRGGRRRAHTYRFICDFLSSYWNVLTGHVGDVSLTSLQEKCNADQRIYTRDISWINKADVVVAEVSTPSLGVGFTIAYAQSKRKPVICLCHHDSKQKLSAMIAGNQRLNILFYHSHEEIDCYLSEFFSQRKEVYHE